MRAQKPYSSSLHLYVLPLCLSHSRCRPVQSAPCAQNHDAQALWYTGACTKKVFSYTSWNFTPICSPLCLSRCRCRLVQTHISAESRFASTLAHMRAGHYLSTLLVRFSAGPFQVVNLSKSLFHVCFRYQTISDGKHFWTLVRTSNVLQCFNALEPRNIRKTQRFAAFLSFRAFGSFFLLWFFLFRSSLLWLSLLWSSVFWPSLLWLVALTYLHLSACRTSDWLIAYKRQIHNLVLHSAPSFSTAKSFPTPRRRFQVDRRCVGVKALASTSSFIVSTALASVAWGIGGDTCLRTCQNSSAAHACGHGPRWCESQQLHKTRGWREIKQKPENTDRYFSSWTWRCGSGLSSLTRTPSFTSSCWSLDLVWASFTNLSPSPGGNAWRHWYAI